MDDLTALPDPPVPADCDLRGLQWIPLYGERLFCSDSWLLSSSEAKCAAMQLWWAAWKQQPAGSLPDQDRALAQMAGYGLAIDAWSEVRVEAMHGFVKCNDGRLYHSVVCELAREAWDRRIKDRERKDQYRARQRSNNALSEQVETRPERGHDADATGTGRGRDMDATRPERVCPSETDAFRNGFVPSDKTRQDSTKKGSKQAARANGAHPACSLDGVHPCTSADDNNPANHGRPMVGGWFLDRVFDKATVAAGIDPSKSAVQWDPVIKWLRDGIDPDVIYAAIRRCADRDGYRPPNSLKWFDKAVREQRPEP